LGISRSKEKTWGINPDNEFIQELQQVTFQPVFILGLHCSGTSIHYKMLTETGNFNPVTAYHLINYNELLLTHHLKKEEFAEQLLTESFREKGLQDRGIWVSSQQKNRSDVHYQKKRCALYRDV
jgi:hypothetical protein